MEVEYKEVPGSDGKYFAGNDGNVYNRKGHKLKQMINGSGYKLVVLYMPRVGKKYVFVHKLVFECFVMSVGMKFPVGFRDGNKDNCSPTNLLVKT